MKVTRHLSLFCLLIFCLLGCTKKQSKAEKINSLLETYVRKMQGIRRFSNIYHTTSYLGHIDTTIQYPDTSLVVGVIDDSTITILERAFYFYSYKVCTPSDSIDLNSIIYFERPLGCNHNFESVYYYYKKDSIVIQISGGGRGGSYSDSYFSKN